MYMLILQAWTRMDFVLAIGLLCWRVHGGQWQGLQEKHSPEYVMWATKSRFSSRLMKPNYVAGFKLSTTAEFARTMQKICRGYSKISGRLTLLRHNVSCPVSLEVYYLSKNFPNDVQSGWEIGVAPCDRLYGNVYLWEILFSIEGSWLYYRGHLFSK